MRQSERPAGIKWDPDWPRFVFRVTLVVSVVACFAIYMAYASPPAKAAPSPTMDTIYYTRFGGVYCGNMEYTTCGVHLFNCTDERDYICLRDVALKKVSPDEKPAEN